MRSVSLVLMTALVTSGCSLPGLSGDVGYAMLSLSGDVGLSNAGGGVFAEQSVDDFGLGEEQGTPYARVELDMGMPVLSAKGFVFEEETTGELTVPFGSIGGGATVDSKLSLTNIQGALAFEFALGPISLAPGIAVEYLDFDMTVSDAAGIASESVNWQAPIPMGYLRAEADVWMLHGMAEIGYIQIPEIQGVEGTFWDLDMTVAYRPTPALRLFAGYRHIHVDGSGVTDGRDFATDLDLAGWVFGGGIGF